jgi:hypothetical protein
MDEIYGYLPPTANPPSKTPMLTLLKQARAFGLGLVLATQNPVDLDYKALSNAGTWFIGRLQTERDKARVLDGLEGAAAATGSSFNRQDMDRIISGLGSRVFLLNNTHEDQPVVMTSRWALSYLCGPLTREQIRTLMAPIKAAIAPVQPGAQTTPVSVAAPTTVASAPVPAASVTRSSAPSTDGQPPALPPEIQQYYLPIRGRVTAGNTLVYRPYILGAARISFADAKSRINTAQAQTYLTEISDAAIPVDWEKAELLDIAVADLEKRPTDASVGGIKFAQLPSTAGIAKNYTGWTRDFTTWLYGSQVLELFFSPSQKTYSTVGEIERDFRIRLGQGAREQRDAAIDTLRKKYAPRIATLQERLRKAQQAVEREKAQASQAGLQTAISIGATLLGAFTGRKIASGGTVGRASSAARGVGRTMSQREDVSRAEDSVEAVQQQLTELTSEFDSESTNLAARIDPATEALDTVTIKPKKADITVQLLVLAWAPYWRDETDSIKPAW